jgi:hypothetical protein
MPTVRRGAERCRLTPSTLSAEHVRAARGTPPQPCPRDAPLGRRAVLSLAAHVSPAEQAAGMVPVAALGGGLQFLIRPEPAAEGRDGVQYSPVPASLKRPQRRADVCDGADKRVVYADGTPAVYSAVMLGSNRVSGLPKPMIIA